MTTTLIWAVAALMFGIFFCLLFRKPLARLIDRAVSIKYPGGGIDLESEIGRLAASVSRTPKSKPKRRLGRKRTVSKQTRKAIVGPFFLKSGRHGSGPALNQPVFAEFKRLDSKNPEIIVKGAWSILEEILRRKLKAKGRVPVSDHTRLSDQAVQEKLIDKAQGDLIQNLAFLRDQVVYGLSPGIQQISADKYAALVHGVYRDLLL